MNINQLSLVQIRVFEALFRHRNMTTAASELNLSQSGISQHLKALEQDFKKPLFDRLHHVLMPTEIAGTLYPDIQTALSLLSKALGEKTQSSDISGLIRIGMPVEFAYNIGIPRLAPFFKSHPQTKLELRLGYAHEIREMVVQDKLDFAFLDSVNKDRRVNEIAVYREKLELCASKKYLSSKKFPDKAPKKQDFENLEYFEYESGAPFLKLWFKKNIRSPHMNLNIRVQVQDAQAIFRFIMADLGAGILPSHLLQELENQDSIVSFSSLLGRPPLASNEIVLVRSKGRSLFQAPEHCLKFIVQTINQERDQNKKTKGKTQ